MKFMLFFAMWASALMASPLSITPERTVTPLIDIFSTSNKQLDSKTMEVRVSPWSKTGSIAKGKDKLKISIENYQRALKLSSAVYQMIPSESSINSADGLIHMGTAFHIGENLVLTNQHVLSPDRLNKSECGGFQLHGNTNADVFTCKKVHHCDAEQDVCLIEMRPTTRCLNTFCTKSKIVQLKDGAVLKLKASPEMSYETADSLVMTCIGNTMGYGIHYSQGSGIRINGDRTYFFAPLRTGNSGGPLIGEDGLVWGVVKQESEVKVGLDAYNVAVSVDKVISLIREELSNDKITLDKFNNSIEE